MTQEQENINIIIARNNEFIDEKFKRLETMLTLFNVQNDKDHKEIIDYQRKQNKKVNQSCEDIERTNKDIIRLRQGKVVWYLMTAFATLSATLITYIVSI